MKPLQQYHRHNANGMNFRKDVILDALSEGSCTTQYLMDACIHIGLGSQATLHREIHEMIDCGFISARVYKRDAREVILKITASGKKYLGAL